VVGGRRSVPHPGCRRPGRRRTIERVHEPPGEPTMTVTRTQGAPRPQLIGDHVELGTKPGYDSPVLGLAVHADRLFATHYHSTADPSHPSTEKGTLVVLDRVSLAEVAPRIEVGWQPRQVVVNPTSRHIYVFNYGADSKSITIVGLDSLQVEGEIKP